MSEALDPAVARPGIVCSSRITRVTVHGRGAVVTREVTVPSSLPATPTELRVSGVTIFADPGSARVVLPEDARELVSIESRVAVPEADPGPGPSSRRVREAEHELERLDELRAALQRRATRLESFRTTPFGRRTLTESGPEERLGRALELDRIVHDELAHVHSRLVELEVEMERTRTERDRLALEDQQASDEERRGEGRVTREFAVLVGGGEGRIDSFELTYVVPHAAKWWPVYSLRLEDAGQRATLTLEAVVAQRTGEDWRDVNVSLATSEIVFDATLPRLPSLRLGKRQPPARLGFREPPRGVDRLFQSYDAFEGRLEPLPTGSSTREMAALSAPPAPPHVPSPQPAEPPEAFMSRDSFADFDESAPRAMAPAAAPKRAASRSARVGATMMEGLQSFAGGGGPPAPPGAPAPPPPPEPNFEPGDDWLHFDELVMAGPDTPQRGKLRRESKLRTNTSELYDARESARRMELVDPAVSRGLFDYRYDAEGTARVPADGRLHRLELQSASADSVLVWRTVPVVDPQVYREANLHNPFDSPLLAGPIDVYSEGQLVTTTRVQRVDAGGTIRIGLGVDERLRVARNVRMTEESAGILKGKRELDHDVTIELRSSLGFPAVVEVLERVPVTNDDTVEVEVLKASPGLEEYDQRDLESPIKGGRRWKVNIGAGERAERKLRYRITLRSRDEIEGGNRRD